MVKKNYSSYLTLKVCYISVSMWTPTKGMWTSMNDVCCYFWTWHRGISEINHWRWVSRPLSRCYTSSHQCKIGLRSGQGQVLPRQTGMNHFFMDLSLCVKQESALLKLLLEEHRRVTAPILHTKVCLKVLGSTTAYVQKVVGRFFLSPHGAVQGLVNCLK